MLSFGVSFMADPPVSEVVRRTVLAEQNEFSHAWLWDSHVLWQEVYPIFTLMAAGTDQIHIGPCVTNPVTRDPTVTAAAMATLNEISGGRMEMAIGRGDSAQRVLGRKPVPVAEMERACVLIRDLAEGREVDLDGTPVRLKWSEGHRLPVWVAAYGPLALRCAGRVADGVVLQLADPFIIEWALRYIREGAQQAGREFGEIKLMAAAPAYISADLAHPGDRGPVFRLRGAIPLGVLLGAEVRPVEDLLETDDLSALARGVGDHLDVLVHRVLLGHVGLCLDQRSADLTHGYALLSACLS